NVFRPHGNVVVRGDVATVVHVDSVEVRPRGGADQRTEAGLQRPIRSRSSSAAIRAIVCLVRYWMKPNFRGSIHGSSTAPDIRQARRYNMIRGLIHGQRL